MTYLYFKNGQFIDARASLMELGDGVTVIKSSIFPMMDDAGIGLLPVEDQPAGFPDGLTQDEEGLWVVSLAYIKQAARDAVRETHAHMLVSATGNSTKEERDTWPEKSREAELYLNGERDHERLPALSTEAATLDIDISVLVERINVKKTSFAKLVGAASAIKTKTNAAIESAATAEEVHAALDTAKAQANSINDDA